MEELQQIIEKLDRLKIELDELRPTDADALHRLNQKLRLEWNYHSNSIEGNSLTLSETKSFLLFGMTAKGKPFRDYVEMEGHNKALKKLEAMVSTDLRITEKLIKDFHKMILVEPDTDAEAEINPGHYKKRNNYLYSETGERIDFTDKDDVPALVNDLVNWLNNQISPPKRQKKKYSLHPLLIAAQFHVRFVKIHPFGDGNGRMARLLTNLILMLTGYTPAIVKKEMRTAYYLSLDDNSTENFSVFLGKACIETMELAIKAAKGKPLEEPEDWKKEVDLLGRQVSAKSKQEELEHAQMISNQAIARTNWLKRNLPLIFKTFDDTFLPFASMARTSWFTLTFWSPIKENTTLERLTGKPNLVDEVISYFDADGRQLDVNYYFENLVAYPKEEFYFRGQIGIYFKDDLAIIKIFYSANNTKVISQSMSDNLGSNDLQEIQALGRNLVNEIKIATDTK